MRTSYCPKKQEITYMFIFACVCVCSVIDRRGVVPRDVVNQNTRSSNGHQSSAAVAV